MDLARGPWFAETSEDLAPLEAIGEYGQGATLSIKTVTGAQGGHVSAVISDECVSCSKSPNDLAFMMAP